MSYSQKNLKKMGKIVANQKKESMKELISEYEKLLYDTFSRGIKCNSNINILQHTFGYISKNITSDEKKMFHNSLDNYKNKKVSLEIPVAIMKSWIIRFDESYLKNQTYFEPYPPDLN